MDDYNKRHNKIIWFAVAFVFFMVIVNIVSAATQLETDQEKYYKDYGKYFTENEGDYKVFTYEELCKGFYTVEEKNKKVVYTGYGDLADKYTYEVDIIDSIIIASSTDVGTDPSGL